eukprot:5292519-Pleurochrysis_carterae.AAC.1
MDIKPTAPAVSLQEPVGVFTEKRELTCLGDLQILHPSVLPLGLLICWGYTRRSTSTARHRPCRPKGYCPMSTRRRFHVGIAADCYLRGAAIAYLSSQSLVFVDRELDIAWCADGGPPPSSRTVIVKVIVTSSYEDMSLRRP